VCFDEPGFLVTFLVERLSGIGIDRHPAAVGPP
jgi:hypothetical protein